MKKLLISLMLCVSPLVMALPSSVSINQLIEQDSLVEANKQIDSVLIAKPNSPLAFFYKSLLAFKAGNFQESEFYLKLAEKNEPHLNFVKNKEIYFIFRKDLYEVLRQPELYQEYKNKNYLKAIK